MGLQVWLMTSKQTEPDISSTFGWNMRFSKPIEGDLNGYSFGRVTCTFQVPPWYGAAILFVDMRCPDTSIVVSAAAGKKTPPRERDTKGKMYQRTERSSLTRAAARVVLRVRSRVEKMRQNQQGRRCVGCACMQQTNSYKLITRNESKQRTLYVGLRVSKNHAEGRPTGKGRVQHPRARAAKADRGRVCCCPRSGRDVTRA